MQELKELINLTKKLAEKYKKYDRHFTLDGKLVGDIGEVLVAEYYNVELYAEREKKYDAKEIGTNKKIQIKSSMKGYYSFPYDYVPDHFLAIYIYDDGSMEEVFNGPGHIVDKYIKTKKIANFKEHYHSLTKGVLEKLNKNVNDKDRIKKKQI